MDWSEAIQTAVDFAGGRSSITLGELNALLPSDTKPDDIDVIRTGLCDRGIWLTDKRSDAEIAR